MEHEVWKLATIPVVAGVIGYVTNWLAVRMMFAPLRFVGVWPAGWQGVIPSKAAKMGSISVDRGLAKLGSLEEFYQQLDPQLLAEHVLLHSRDDIRALVDRIVSREHPGLWANLPPQLREAVHRRVQAQLPRLVDEITGDIGGHIDHLMDLKLMVIDRLRDQPQLVNRIFLEVGAKEFRFIVRSGFYFGVALGLVQMTVWIFWPVWWVLPAAGLLIGYLTNWLALQVIFRPCEPVWVVRRWRVQGLFIGRQAEVAQTYAAIVTGEVLTLRNLVHELMYGPKSDRTRRLIEDRVRPAVDQALGLVAPAVRAAVGSRRYDVIRRSLATEGTGPALQPLSDPEFSRARSAALGELISARMRALPPPEYAELLHAAFKEDEWKLIAVGAALGGAAGVVQLVTLFGGG